MAKKNYPNMYANELLLILPTYQQFEYSKRCLDSFVRYIHPNISVAAIIDDASPNFYKHFLSNWPCCNKIIYHYDDHQGLTRSWNKGLLIAKEHGYEYTLCCNDDVLFTENWYQPLKDALKVYALVGPVTNAPGHAPWQNINNFTKFIPTDDVEKLNEYTRILRSKYLNAITVPFINGFCMFAKTSTWWDNAFSSECVFNPAYPLTGNENELQMRWLLNKKKIGLVPSSFVFHYRSISRSEALDTDASKGAYRRT